MRVRLEVEKQIVKNPYAELMVARTLLVVIRCFVFVQKISEGFAFSKSASHAANGTGNHTSSVYCVSMHFAKVAVRKRIPIGNYTFP